MKSLSAGAQFGSSRQYAEPGYLVQIDFTAPSAKTLYLSDDYRNMLGQEWMPLVQSFGSLDTMLNMLNVDGSPATAQLTLFNTMPIEGKPRISDLIRTPVNTSGTYEWAFAKVTVYQLFAGLTSGDEVKLGVFYLEDPTDFGEDLLQLRMSDQSLAIEDALGVTRVDRAQFPRCPKTSVGLSIRRPFGPLKNVPLVQTVDSAADRLDGGISAADTALALIDATDFPTSGYVQIDGEHIQYSGKSGNSLTGLTRARNSTTAAIHAHITPVYEVPSGFSLGFRVTAGEHAGAYKIRSVANVTIDGQPPAVSPILIPEDTVSVPGKNLVTIILPGALKFFTPISVSAERDVAVTTLSTVLNGNAGSPTSPLARTIAPSCIGGTTLTNRSMNCTVMRGGNLVGVVFWTVVRRLSGGTDVVVRNGTFAAFEGGSVNFSDTQSYASTADEIVSLTFSGGEWNDGTLALSFANYHVKDSATQLAGGGPTTLGEVRADIEGLQDDATGTFTGTPGALIENPADVTRFILTQFYGISAADLGSTWAVTRAALAAAGYKWALVLDYAPFSQLRLKIGEQARSALYLEAGKWEYKYLTDTPIASLTLDYNREIWKESPARVTRSNRTDIRNSLNVSAQRDYASGSYTYLKVQEDLTSLTTRQSAELVLEWVQDSATADALGVYWLSVWKRQRFEVELVTWWNALALDAVDYLAIDNHPILTAFGGSGLIFRVTGLQRDLNTDRVQIQGIEVAFFPAPPAEGDEALRAGHIWGLTLSNNAGDATNDLDVAAGEAVSDEAASASRVLMELTSGLTKQLDATWAAGTGAGGRVSGQSLADGTWHVFLFRRQAGGIDVCFSNSLTFTTPDSGTNRRRIGSILRVSAAIVAFEQDGDYFARKASILDVNVTNPGTTAVLRALSVPTGIKVYARLHAGVAITTVHGILYVSDPAVNDEAPSQTAAPLGQLDGNALANTFLQVPLLSVRTNVNGEVRTRITSTDTTNITLRIALLGLIDRRGRDA